MQTQILKVATLIALASNIAIAGSCSGGACTASVTPYIPSDIQENANLKPFNLSGEKEVKEDY